MKVQVLTIALLTYQIFGKSQAISSTSKDLSSQKLSLDAFNTQLFWEQPEEGLYEVDVGLRPGEGEQGSYLMAFADINNDKYTDVITVNQDASTYTVHLFDTIKNLFLHQKTFRPDDCKKILNVAVGRSVEKLRLFITCDNKNGSRSVRFYDKQQKTFDFAMAPMSVQIEEGSQPFVGDLNGDFLEDIIFTDKNHNLMVAFQSRSSPTSLVIQDFDSSMLVLDETEGCLSKKGGKAKLSTPHSVSLIDFDGDCLSDLFLTVTDQSSGKQYYELYLRREVSSQADEDEEDGGSGQAGSSSSKKGLNSYCLVQRDEIPSSSESLFHFADADRDSMVDMIFVTRNDLSLHVFYNKLGQHAKEERSDEPQFPQFGGLSQVCAETNRPVNRVKDIYSPFAQPEEKYVIKQAISGDGQVGDLMDHDREVPARIYVGDITSDGFPDILVTVKYLNGTSTPKILVNQACDSTSCSQKAVKARRRTFSLLTNQYQDLLSKFEDARYAVFFDLNENSMMDILVVHGTSLSAIYNNFAKDAFFLKTRMVSDDTLGTSTQAASFRCVLTDLADFKFVVAAGQSGQTAFGALQMPFAHVGIGRSNNFVESYTVAVDVNGTRSLRQWTPIIPKSVLFVMANNQQEPETWTLDILISPTEKMIIVIFVDTIFLLILGVIIIILHLVEKAEDRKEQELFDYF